MENNIPPQDPTTPSQDLSQPQAEAQPLAQQGEAQPPTQGEAQPLAQTETQTQVPSVGGAVETPVLDASTPLEAPPQVFSNLRVKNWRDLIRPRTLEPEIKTATYGKFSCEPLERGFGITLGNSLRRVLLSCLQGAAITHGPV